MRPGERQAQILDLVEREGEATVESLAAAFAVSAETIRRVLPQLAESGYLKSLVFRL